MDYSKLSDFEINLSVAIAIGFNPDECDIAKRGSPSVGVEWNEDTGYPIRVFDYCNNPTDAWPIIVDSKICLEVASGDGRLWLAEDWKNVGSSWHKDSNPLRAAMIVFLKMQDSANVQGNPAR